MDFREQSFRRKFKSASEFLGAQPEQIVSMKVRDNVRSYEEYRRLIDFLQGEAGIQCTKLDGDLQGQGYLLGSDKTKVILVEHESGLEILYIAGSIASLLGLVPAILHGWSVLRGQFGGRDARMGDPVEIRRIDGAGRVLEEHLHNRHLLGSGMSSAFVLPVIEVAALIENEMKAATQQVEILTSRVENLEKHFRREKRPGVKKKVAKPKPHPSRSPRAKKPKTKRS